MIINQEARSLAKTIWDYHQLNHQLKPADIIFTLGGHDLRVADRAVELYFQQMAPTIVFSGGLGNFTKGVWTNTEADRFSKIARDKGVPPDKILIENQSTNTGENVTFTQTLLAKHGIAVKTVIAVQKPYMERRTYATIKKLWPEIELMVTSPQLSYEQYPNDQISEEQVIQIMVGDLQRIRDYPAKGFQIPQDIPPEVTTAFDKLVEYGFNKHLLP